MLGAEDAIVCVGDGYTPRTAALFACRLPEVQCYSIDPALAGCVGDVHIMANRQDIDEIENGDDAQRVGGLVDMTPLTEDTVSSLQGLELQTQETAREHNQGRLCVHMRPSTHPWSHISRLHVVPHKIQDVRLRCSRAVIVLLHAHVSIQEVQDALFCHHTPTRGEVVGIIAVPCCNFRPLQASYRGHPPDLIFRDAALLSDQNELRVWNHSCTLDQASPTPTLTESAATPLLSPPTAVADTDMKALVQTKNKKLKRQNDKKQRRLKTFQIEQRMAILRRSRDQVRGHELQLCNDSNVLDSDPLAASNIPDDLSLSVFCLSAGLDYKLVVTSHKQHKWEDIVHQCSLSLSSSVLQKTDRSDSHDHHVETSSATAACPGVIQAQMKVIGKKYGGRNIRLQLISVTVSATSLSVAAPMGEKCCTCYCNPHHFFEGEGEEDEKVNRNCCGSRKEEPPDPDDQESITRIIAVRSGATCARNRHHCNCYCHCGEDTLRMRKAVRVGDVVEVRGEAKRK